MNLKSLEIAGFKSFAKKTDLAFDVPITAIVGPNGSGKSNVAEAFRWVLGEQSMKSLRGKRGEDLIFNGAASAGRLSRASVRVTFDNADKKFPLEYDEVSVERVVYRDGVNEYSINGNVVRLKDVLELLSAVSLGASSHHIISQNEADRILLSNPKERKQMIEDALGLRVYHWKITEAERKLEKTLENIKEARTVRKEISGHLRFLEKEAEKIEKGKTLRESLRGLYGQFVAGEELFLEKEKGTLGELLSKNKEALSHIQNEVEKLSRTREGHTASEQKEIIALDNVLFVLKEKRNDIARQLGRLEGMIELARREERESGKSNVTYTHKEIEAFTGELEQLLSRAENTTSFQEVRDIVSGARRLIHSLKKEEHGTARAKSGLILSDIEGQIEKLEEELRLLENEEKEANKKKSDALHKETVERKDELARERAYFEAREHEAGLLRTRADLERKWGALSGREETLALARTTIERLFGKDGAHALYTQLPHIKKELAHITEHAQEQLRKEIDRAHILLDEMGGGGEAMINEYEEIKNRDEFLKKEILDLEDTEKSLGAVMKELQQKLHEEFKVGVTHINTEFTKFFELLFGGGKATVQVVSLAKRPQSEEEFAQALEGDAEKEDGIDISISLPRKKIRGLEMLSGGERALTSIALLFAMSQVKPPPFLILDETDAALDEANSKKYGDMLAALSKETQLIVVTHNRETMSRAGILYGVTMGGDGVSKLLSVRFEEAVKIAK
jgi:chromosome segregation protein